jgi:hypothetical protein
MRLSLIDETNRHDHYRLTEADTCYYLFEYTSRKGFSFSRTNNLISNLKKKPSQRHRPGYHYKQQAIGESAAALRASLNPDWLNNATLVPVPCSKANCHPDYDDRVERICRAIAPNVDVRTLVIQTESTVASHEAEDGHRITVEELLDIYAIDETLVDPPPQVIGIVDDVLTNGTHFRAMSVKLQERFPGVPIVGLFVARRVFPEEEFDWPDLD